MRAMVLEHARPVEDNPLAMSQIPVPEPLDHEILLRVHACGVCHTDLHTVEGDLPLPRLPLVPGHQVVGVVERTGSAANRFAVGDRVGMTWFSSSCGICKFCVNGKENLCAHARFTGYHTDGGYAEFMIASERSAFRIPAVFSDAEATPLLCGGVIGYRALRLSEIKPGRTSVCTGSAIRLTW